MGLDTTQWLNIGLSLLVLLLGPTVGRRLMSAWLGRIVHAIVGRTETTLDDALLPAARMPLHMLLFVAAAHWALTRITFLPPATLPFWRQFFFLAYLTLAVALGWRLVTSFFEWYSDNRADRADTKLATQALPLLRRLVLAIVSGIALIILLGRFNVDVSALVATLGIGSLAIALAAQAALSDTISGILIMIDRPFRIGDRIEIRDLSTWGDVVDIGLRSTRIHTRDNRTVIVPNSVIEKSLVVNHSFPDTYYRIEMEVGVAYGTDLNIARETLVKAIRGVPGVLPDRPIDALFLNFGDSALIFRLRWWIENFTKTRQMFDRVNSSVYNSLRSAGILIPFPQREIRIVRETLEPQPDVLPSHSARLDDSA
ncbi:MAG: mechanosensitive ion channel [Anaerolineales bacterium]|nr:mechanosensitive ion channel [Anaerolineales bacterium]